MSTDKFWRMQASDGAAGLDLFGQIGGEWYDDFDESDIAYSLSALPPAAALTVRVNSPGGSVFAAMAIKRLLEARAAIAPVSIEVVGLAASAATLITSAIGIPVRMATGAMMLIHPARMSVDGLTAEEMQAEAEGLEKVRLGIRAIYKAKTGLDDAELDALMAKESYLTAEEAVHLGFADAMLADGEKTEEGEEEEAPDRVPAPLPVRPPRDASRLFAVVACLRGPAPVSGPEKAADIKAPAPEEKAPEKPVSAPAEAPEAAAEAQPEARIDPVAVALAKERARVSAIHELSAGIAGCDDLIRAAMADGSSAEALAVRLVARLKTFPAVAMGARLQDAADLTGLEAAGNFGTPDTARAEEEEEAKQKERETLISAGKRGFFGG